MIYSTEILLNNINEANQNLVSANRLLLEAIKLVNEDQRRQLKGAKKFRDAVFSMDKKNERLGKTTSRVLAELSRRNHPINVTTIARNIDKPITTVYGAIYRLRKAGYKIDKITGSSKIKYKLVA